jgi:hypothetical protein
MNITQMLKGPTSGDEILDHKVKVRFLKVYYFPYHLTIFLPISDDHQVIHRV